MKGKLKLKENIKLQISILPSSSGVYIMKDSDGEVIYIGKAKNLKARISSYFRGFSSHSPKTQTLVVNIADFDYFLTDTETEALILEANLIKRYLPRFNILLKDDKSYPFVVVTNEDFPTIFSTRTPERYEGARVYGPFTSVESVNIATEFIRINYKIRESRKPLTGDEPRPCLNYHIARCSAPCCGYISKDDYGELVAQAERIFAGDAKDVLGRLRAEMVEAARVMNFELAARLRDQIRAIEGLSVRQKAIQNNLKNQDYISGHIEGDRAVGMLFQIRGGKLLGREVFTMLNVGNSNLSEVIGAFVNQYYSGSANIPKEIYLSEDIENIEATESWFGQLIGGRVRIMVPKRGEKLKTINLVRKNAQEYLLKYQKRIERQYEARVLAAKELTEVMGIGENLEFNRIEAFDISNTSGVYSVGSMVVFEGGQKKKSDYRRYRIKTVEGSDDYASMQEIVFRRYSRKDGQELGMKMPDLVLIDGGKGHVNAVLEVLDALDLHMPVAGMVKDDFHKTNDLVYNGKVRGLKDYKNAFRAVYEIQEEAHRFAIEYHKSLRSSEMLNSELDEIKGIGEKRKIILMRELKSIDAIKKADLKTLMGIKGITSTAAKAVYEFFENSDNKE